MTPEGRPLITSPEERELLDTVKALSRALQIALPHLPADVLRGVSRALAPESLFVPEGRPAFGLQPSSVEQELRTAWSSLDSPAEP